MFVKQIVIQIAAFLVAKCNMMCANSLAYLYSRQQYCVRGDSRVWTRVTCHVSRGGARVVTTRGYSVKGDTVVFILSFIFITQMQTQRAGDRGG